MRQVLQHHDPSIDLSLVAPVYEEEDNLEPLFEMVSKGLETSKLRWELVLVDDGSSDDSWNRIVRLGDTDPRVRGVRFRENRGQSAAMATGIAAAHGTLIATLDADLQNDPADLPRMVSELQRREVDVIVGYRAKRKDDAIRRLSSKLANRVRNGLTGDTIRDTGCSLKVFTRAAAASIPWFDGMHRFLPTVLRYQGFEVDEVPVDHHPRQFGLSKYGVWNRAFRAGRDLFAIRWMKARMLTVSVAETNDPRTKTIAPQASANRPEGTSRPVDRETAR